MLNDRYGKDKRSLYRIIEVSAMSFRTTGFIATSLAISCLCGCLVGKKDDSVFKPSTAACENIPVGPGLPIEHPAGIRPADSPSNMEPSPLDDFSFSNPENYRMMSLEECIYLALKSSPVIRELGGAILQAPGQATTVQDPALAYSDPRFGEEAALSAFDANLNTQLTFQKNDRVFNNQFIGLNGFFQQNIASYRNGISKTAATGATFEFNHAIDYDFNNSSSNQFNRANGRSKSYDTFFEAGFRQPFLQGAGVAFNRIAGPNNAPGVYNGVLVARANTDVSLAEFETRVRNLVSDVENAYWDLYFAYRDLETRIEARDGAYDVWASTDANESDAAITNQAAEQYYRFAADVENAIHGRLNDGTRTNNGSSGGTFRNNSGVRRAERRMRLITGMALNDSQLIVPKDQPVEAAVVFDWEQSKADALIRRPELRRQRWQIKRRELECVASKNFLLPRVDLLGQYRVRGFGENLFGERGFAGSGTAISVPSGSAATASLLDGDLQEWEVGVDVNIPIGYRRQHAAVRNAELNLAREKSILTEQERTIIYGLSNALGELQRSLRVRKANIRRLEAAKAQYEAIKVVYEEEGRTIDQLLEAQRRVIEAKTEYYQSQVEHMLAVRSVHFEKGTLFNYHNVNMNESAWDGEAYSQAAERAKWNTERLSFYFRGLHTGLNGRNAPENNPPSWSSLVTTLAEKVKKTKDSPDSEFSETQIAEIAEADGSSLLALATEDGQNKLEDAVKASKAISTKESETAVASAIEKAKSKSTAATAQLADTADGKAKDNSFDTTRKPVAANFSSELSTLPTATDETLAAIAKSESSPKIKTQPGDKAVRGNAVRLSDAPASAATVIANAEPAPATPELTKPSAAESQSIEMNFVQTGVAYTSPVKPATVNLSDGKTTSGETNSGGAFSPLSISTIRPSSVTSSRRSSRSTRRVQASSEPQTQAPAARVSNLPLSSGSSRR